MTDERKAVKYHDRLVAMLERAICICSHEDFRSPCSWCDKRDDLLFEIRAKADRP